MIRPEFIQSVVQPAVHVFDAVAGIKMEVERVQMVSSIQVLKSICVGLSFEGGAQGGVYLVVDHPVGASIARRMTGASAAGALNEGDVVEALMELVNMFAGNAISLLSRNRLHVEITPPERFEDSPPVPYGAGCAVAYLKSEVGSVKVGVVVAESAG